MKIRNGYLLREIAGQPYLLPYGQNISDHKRGIRLNESGLLILKKLSADASFEELLSMLKEHYQTDESDVSMLRKDLEQFLRQLHDFYVLEQEIPIPPADLHFSIGPFRIGYQGPDSLIHPMLRKFAAISGPLDQLITVHGGYPSVRGTGTILVRSEEIIICDAGEEYLFLFPRHSRILECHLKKDGSLTRFYCVPPFEGHLAETLFHAIRFAFSVLAQVRGLFVIHSASILYRDKAWLFSGPSGAGKSTHADLWETLYHTRVLNGDLNLIGMEDGIPYVYGLPWCGTSGICSTKRVPLGGITLLKQHPSDKLLHVSEDEKPLLVAQRFISPAWTEAQFSSCLDFSQMLTEKIPVFRLFCTKEASAAKTMKTAIDKHLTKN